MATYGNTGGNGLNINVYSGSGGNLNEWALDYDGLKLLTIPEVITASNITTNQTVTITLKAKPIFNNISVSFFRVKLPDGSIAEFPAINNTAIFTIPIAGALGSQQTLLVYARDNSGNRSAVASHLYTVVNSLPTSTSAITHNIPSSFSAGDVKQIQISGAVDPEGDPYTYSLILPPEISGSKISGIANNETVTLTVQNTIDYTKQDNIVIRVTDINGAQDDKVLTVTLLSGGSSGGTNNFNVRTSFPSSVYPNEVFTAKIWELGTNNYTYGLNLPSGISSSKTSGILSNEIFTITVAPNVAPNSTVAIDVVVYTGSVSVGSFVVNMLVDGVTGEMSYTTPGSYEFTVPNTVNSISMLQIYTDKLVEGTVNAGGFSIENLKESNLIRKSISGWSVGDRTVQRINNMIFTTHGGFKYTIDNFETINTVVLPNMNNDSLIVHNAAYGNGSYIISGVPYSGPVNNNSTFLSVNNGSTWSQIPTAEIVNSTPHRCILFHNSVFYIVSGTSDNLVSVDGGYTFVKKPLPLSYQNMSLPRDPIIINDSGVYRLFYGNGTTSKLHLLKSIDKCSSWVEVTIPNITGVVSPRFKYINNRYVIMYNISPTAYNLHWTDDLINWNITTYDFADQKDYEFGEQIYYFDNHYLISTSKNIGIFPFIKLDDTMTFVNTIFISSGLHPSAILQINDNNSDMLFGSSRKHMPQDNAFSIVPTLFLSTSLDNAISLDNLFGINNNTQKYYYCANNEIVVLSPKPQSYEFDVIRIKLTSTTNSTTGMFLINDFSDKNVVTSHTVANMSFKDVVTSGNNLLAINKIDGKLYINTIGTSLWEVIPEVILASSPTSISTVNMHVYGNSVIVNAPTLRKMYFSSDSGNTWSSHDVTNSSSGRGYNHSVLYKGKIYSTEYPISADGYYFAYEYNLNNSTETFLATTISGYLYVLNNVLIAARHPSTSGGLSTTPYYFDEYYLTPGDAFRSVVLVNENYHLLFPYKLREDIWNLRNYSSKYIIADNSSIGFPIYGPAVKNITLNDIINNQISTINLLTTGYITTTDGLTNSHDSNENQMRVYDDFIFRISNWLLSISTDGGLTYTSINTNSTINDVVVNNGIIYIFSGNTVKKIVPSILDNSNIINKEVGTGYSLTNPKLAGNFGKNGYAKYLNNIEVTPGDKLNINVTSPDGGVRLVWGTNRFFPTNAS